MRVIASLLDSPDPMLKLGACSSIARICLALKYQYPCNRTIITATMDSSSSSSSSNTGTNATHNGQSAAALAFSASSLFDNAEDAIVGKLLLSIGTFKKSKGGNITLACAAVYSAAIIASILCSPNLLLTATVAVETNSFEGVKVSAQNMVGKVLDAFIGMAYCKNTEVISAIVLVLPLLGFNLAINRVLAIKCAERPVLKCSVAIWLWKILDSTFIPKNFDKSYLPGARFLFLKVMIPRSFFFYVALYYLMRFKPFPDAGPREACGCTRGRINCCTGRNNSCLAVMLFESSQ